MLPVEIGSRFGRLVVIGLIPHAKNPKAECKCDCGSVCYPQRGALRNGKAKSCGCLRREKLVEAARTHGMSRTSTYRIWQNILVRCNNPSNRHYQNYGGRGITCEYKSFEEFLADVGERPPFHWIDRIDNDKGYEPGNCEWVSPRKNQENKRLSKYWIIDGVIYESSVKAAFVLGVSPSVIVRGCNGFTREGRTYPPRNGWSCAYKYENS